MASAGALRKLHPRRAREYTGGEECTERSESSETVDGAALIRRLKAGSPHFGAFAFRTAFCSRCLDTGTLAAVLGRCYRSPCGRQVLLGDGVAEARVRLVARPGGVACGGGNRHGAVVFVEHSALDAAAVVAAEHRCNTLGLAFAAHAVEDGLREGVSAEEAELLARTSYGAAYVSPAVCRDLARAYGSEWPGADGAGPTAMPYPRPGEAEVLAVENVWVLRDRTGPALGEECGPFLPPDGAWPLTVALGLVPEASGGVADEAALKSARLRYKRQVTSVVQACALAGCDGLLVGCAEGVLGAEAAPHPAAAAAAEVWAEVLLGEGSAPGLAAHFRAVAFCLGGRANRRRIEATKAELLAAFAR